MPLITLSLISLQLRVAAPVVLWITTGGGPSLRAKDGEFQVQRSKFFQKHTVEFWKTRKPAVPQIPATPELFPETPAMPAPVRALVQDPTPENAQAYLQWQQERARRIAAALHALERARSPEQP